MTNRLVFNLACKFKYFQNLSLFLKIRILNSIFAFDLQYFLEKLQFKYDFVDSWMSLLKYCA